MKVGYRYAPSGKFYKFSKKIQKFGKLSRHDNLMAKKSMVKTKLSLEVVESDKFEFKVIKMCTQ